MYEFRLEGRVIPKARPRVAGKRAYLPAHYREWKESAIAALIVQAKKSAIAKPLIGVKVIVQLHGKMRGDADNCIGAILDALVQAAVLVDDRITCVPSISVDYFPGKETYTTIKVETTTPLPTSVNTTVMPSNPYQERIQMETTTVKPIRSK